MAAAAAVLSRCSIPREVAVSPSEANRLRPAQVV
ncbi:hypothetical protein ACP70R_026551 [Stipagrostis hirtigluma subsp. patula]